uniref:Uncharacterized protein n=1 Tax=Gossypium raimondii TaxID=29730 RepID=A0A0D2R597_GOSRA|nr:hypothetical protein B456_004G153800 [Gossypium raimondii]
MRKVSLQRNFGETLKRNLSFHVGFSLPIQQCKNRALQRNQSKRQHKFSCDGSFRSFNFDQEKKPFG